MPECVHRPVAPQTSAEYKAYIEGVMASAARGRDIAKQVGIGCLMLLVIGALVIGGLTCLIMSLH